MENAKRRLSEMAVGNVTIMWDIVAYRVSKSRWIVGETISISQCGNGLEHAAKMICELCMNR